MEKAEHEAMRIANRLSEGQARERDQEQQEMERIAQTEEEARALAQELLAVNQRGRQCENQRGEIMKYKLNTNIHRFKSYFLNYFVLA